MALDADLIFSFLGVVAVVVLTGGTIVVTARLMRDTPDFDPQPESDWRRKGAAPEATGQGTPGGEIDREAPGPSHRGLRS